MTSPDVTSEEIALLLENLETWAFGKPANVCRKAKAAIESLSRQLAEAMAERDKQEAGWRTAFNLAIQHQSRADAAEAALAEARAKLDQQRLAWRFANRRAFAAEAEMTRLREALAEAGLALEVLGIEIVRSPYKEMTADFQDQIIKSRDAVRAALAAAAPPP